jgi:hypothetical protein
MHAKASNKVGFVVVVDDGRWADSRGNPSERCRDSFNCCPIGASVDGQFAAEAAGLSAASPVGTWIWTPRGRVAQVPASAPPCHGLRQWLRLAPSPIAELQRALSNGSGLGFPPPATFFVFDPAANSCVLRHSSNSPCVAAVQIHLLLWAKALAVVLCSLGSIEAAHLFLPRSLSFAGGTYEMPL